MIQVGPFFFFCTPSAARRGSDAVDEVGHIRGTWLKMDQVCEL
jgi:hypothetical protein